MLEPLDAASVRAIAGFYAPAGGGDAMPVETLLATSRGVARRVHEAAGEWARREATRRVEAVADRAAAGRSETRALEAELAGSVVELQSARERADLVARDADEVDAAVVCPYKGLATFDFEDAEYFFGRERLVAELVASLVGAPLLAVVGASGSGKSSVVKAGLLPALAGGVLPGSEKRTQALIRPGEQPLHELRRATRRLSREWQSVLVVDQFEELFTACEDEQERGEFVAGLVHAARDRSLVVLAVRADFYGRCAAYPELSRLVGANHVLVGPMSRDELRRAIERPAQRVGLSIEPELVESLLTDVEGEPGTLPLLSTALLELWRGRDGRRLRHAVYARSGGVQGAVARMAEAAFVGLDPHEQAIARTLLLRLADEGENGTIVRRRIGLAELESAGSPEAAAVVARLTDHRLLTVSDGAIEVAHEALLREWPRLRAWLDEDADRAGACITSSAMPRAAWDADARDPGALYRGARLASALDWAADHDPELNGTERAFLDASRTASGRAQRRLRLVLGAVSLLLVAAVIAGLVALEQRGNARSSERTTEAQALDVQALTEPALDRSLLLARQAVSVVDSPATRSDLLAALLRSPAAIGVLRTDGDPLLSLALSPDGHTLAVAENDGVVRFVDAATLRPVGRPYDAGKARIPELGYSPDSELAYSPDGTRLAVADVTDAYGGFIDLLDGRTHRRIRRLDNGSASGGPSPSPKDVMFSPDSRRLIAHSTSDTASGHGPGHLVVRDARTGRVLKRQNVGNDLGVIGFVAGGRRLLTSSQSTRTTVLRDAENLRPLRSFHVAGRAGASTVTPDGRLAALGAADGSVRLLDLRSGRVRTASGRHDGPVSDARFTPDGRTLVTAGEDTRVMLWNVAEARASETLEGHAGPIRDVAVSPDGKTAYSASLDGSVIAWDLAGTRRLGRPFHIAPVDPGGPVGNCGRCGGQP